MIRSDIKKSKRLTKKILQKLFVGSLVFLKKFLFSKEISSKIYQNAKIILEKNFEEESLNIAGIIKKMGCFFHLSHPVPSSYAEKSYKKFIRFANLPTKNMSKTLSKM